LRLRSRAGLLYFSPMSCAGRVALLALAVALTPAGLGSRPAAADEGESALSIELSFASFSIPDHDGQGGALGLEYERGLSDEFWIRASAAGALYRGGEDGTSYAGHGAVGLTYVVDVLKYVPYLHAGIGAAALGGDAIDREFHPVAELGAGLDILAHRGLSYGAFLRLGSFLDDSAFFTGGLRITWRWGFF
jgi:hypothetical protein